MPRCEKLAMPTALASATRRLTAPATCSPPPSGIRLVCCILSATPVVAGMLYRMRMPLVYLQNTLIMVEPANEFVS